MHHAKVFWSGRSQAIRLPKEFRFDCDEVLIRREGDSVVLEPLDAWPTEYLKSFQGVSEDFERPAQGKREDRPEIFE